MVSSVNKERKIYIVGRGGTGYVNWMQAKIVDNLADANLVLFTGGEDVTPELYGAPAHPKTGNNKQRDDFESVMYGKAKDLGLPCLGICRGSQFLCVKSGGSLIQHQDNPLFKHNIETYDGQTLEITSTHHQAQYPYELPSNSYSLLAWSKGISAYHEDGNQQEMPLPEGKEAEIVYYRDTNCLCIQGHPEMMFDPDHKTIMYLRRLLLAFSQGFLDDYIQTKKYASQQLI